MWSFDQLFKKSAIYARRGIDHPEPNSSESILWCLFSLELLARSALAKTNVALLADPSDGNNVLFACGFPSTKSPKSIPLKTVYHRCTVVCPGFTTDEYNTCMLWANWRNEELHTGAMPLEDLPSGNWMPRYFEIAAKLLDYIEKPLAAFVGGSHVTSAERMIDALSDDHKKEARRLISTSKGSFNSLDVESRLRAIEEGKKKRSRDWSRRITGKEFDCPACEGPSLITGDIVRSTNPHDQDGEFIQEDVRIPTELKCYACGLLLEGHSLLYAIGQGNQFTTVDELDPKDYYGIEFDPDEYYGGYSND